MMDFAEEMAVDFHSAHSYRRMQDCYSFRCLNKGSFPAHFFSSLLKQLHPVTAASTNSPFPQDFCTYICSFFFVRQLKTIQGKLSFSQNRLSPVKRFQFILISCHLSSSSLLVCCSLANFVTKTIIREFIKQENPVAGNSEDTTFLFEVLFFFDLEWL